MNERTIKANKKIHDLFGVCIFLLIFCGIISNENQMLSIGASRFHLWYFIFFVAP